MFTPLEKAILAQLIRFGNDLPRFLATVSTPERIAAVAILARRFPSIPAEIAGELIANPSNVSLVFPQDVPPVIPADGVEGLPKIDLSEFEKQFSDHDTAEDAPCTCPPQTPVVEYLASLSDEDLRSRLTSVRGLADEARALGLSDSEIGKVLGEFGLDWPAGSGDYHGWK
jgi:hypothetical protein